MGTSKHKLSNWPPYNPTLVQRGSLIIWLDQQAIKRWHCQTHHGRRGRGFPYSDTAIETALMLKGLFKLPLWALEAFINSLLVCCHGVNVEQSPYRFSPYKVIT